MTDQPETGSAGPTGSHETLGKYRVLCRLSTGGMSEIYLGQQTGFAGFNKVVVLKTILPAISSEDDFVRMFLVEARVMASFNHPNIAQVYELDIDRGRLFMAMEFVEGCTLLELARALIRDGSTIPIGFTASAVHETALALHYAHTFTDVRGVPRAVIHRDVAEKNVMVTFGGVTKLLDFGVAKAAGRQEQTRAGRVKGTMGYMSPEQVRGETLDARSDVFSLGIVLHECLSGRRLFKANSPVETARAVLGLTPEPPSKLNPAVPPALDAVALTALQLDRDQRYPSGLDMARAIESAVGNLMWRPHQMGELVSRCFEPRRRVVRRTIESLLAPDNTSELNLSVIKARVPALARSPASPSAAGASAPVPAPVAAARPAPETTRPSVSSSPAARAARGGSNPAAPAAPSRVSGPRPAMASPTASQPAPPAPPPARQSGPMAAVSARPPTSSPAAPAAPAAPAGSTTTQEAIPMPGGGRAPSDATTNPERAMVSFKQATNDESFSETEPVLAPVLDEMLSEDERRLLEPQSPGPSGAAVGPPAPEPVTDPSKSLSGLSLEPRTVIAPQGEQPALSRRRWLWIAGGVLALLLAFCLGLLVARL